MICADGEVGIGFVLLSIAGLVYALFFSELFLRYLSPQALVPRYVTAAPWGIRGNIANAVYRHHTPEVDVELRINPQGMRDNRIFPQIKPQGTCRIALFGDFYFMGFEAELEDSIAYQLEQNMRSAGFRVEVSNFAVSGFGNAEMQVALETLVTSSIPTSSCFSGMEAIWPTMSDRACSNWTNRERRGAENHIPAGRRNQLID